MNCRMKMKRPKNKIAVTSTSKLTKIIDAQLKHRAQSH